MPLDVAAAECESGGNLSVRVPSLLRNDELIDTLCNNLTSAIIYICWKAGRVMFIYLFRCMFR